MPVTYKGVETLVSRLITADRNAFDTTTKLGVGNSEEPFAPNQTKLSGDKQLLKTVDNAPIFTEGHIVEFIATFGRDDANFEWLEWGIFNSEAQPIMFNRVQEYSGSKLIGQTWKLKVTLTFNIGGLPWKI